MSQENQNSQMLKPTFDINNMAIPVFIQQSKPSPMDILMKDARILEKSNKYLVKFNQQTGISLSITVCDQTRMPCSIAEFNAINTAFLEFLTNGLGILPNTYNLKISEVEPGLLMISTMMPEFDYAKLKIAETTHEAYFFISYEITDGKISFIEKSKRLMCATCISLTHDQLVDNVYAYTNYYRNSIEWIYVKVISVYMAEFKKHYGHDAVTITEFVNFPIGRKHQCLCKICGDAIPVPDAEAESESSDIDINSILDACMELYPIDEGKY